MFFDSLGIYNKQLVQILRKYIELEWIDKKKVDLQESFVDSEIKKVSSKCVKTIIPDVPY